MVQVHEPTPVLFVQYRSGRKSDSGYWINKTNTQIASSGTTAIVEFRRARNYAGGRAARTAESPIKTLSQQSSLLIKNCALIERYLSSPVVPTPTTLRDEAAQALRAGAREGSHPTI